MTSFYEMCPHCMNQLYERKQPIEDIDSVNICPQCGNKMVIACFGEEGVDDTVYKIILNLSGFNSPQLCCANKLLKK